MSEPLGVSDPLPPIYFPEEPEKFYVPPSIAEPCLVIPDACRCGDLIDRRGSFHCINGALYCSKCFSRMAASGGRVPEHFPTNTGEP